jgi:hypothetical protein
VTVKIECGKVMNRSFLRMLGPQIEFDRRIVLISEFNTFEAEILAHIFSSEILHLILFPTLLIDNLHDVRTAAKTLTNTNPVQKTDKPIEELDPLKKGGNQSDGARFEAEFTRLVDTYITGSNLNVATDADEALMIPVRSKTAVFYDPSFAEALNSGNLTEGYIGKLLRHWNDSELLILSPTRPEGAEIPAFAGTFSERFSDRVRFETFVPTKLDQNAFDQLILGQTPKDDVL